MNRRTRHCLALALLALAWTGCEKPAAPVAAKKAPASEVKALPTEADLTTIHLSEEAVGRLRIGTGTVAVKAVARTRHLGGEVLVSPGHLFIVSAPLSGTLQSPPTGTPEPGSPVRSGQVIFDLIPLLSPEARATLATTLAEAEGGVDQAEKQLAQARLLLDRAERLRRDNLGGTGAVVDAQAQVDVATATLSAAQQRRDAFANTLKGLSEGTLEPVRIAAESGGVLKNLLAGTGQKVAAGAPLFEVMELDPVLIRVPVYVGDLDRIDESLPVEIGGLSDPPGAPTRTAQPMPAPPTANALGSSADLYYRISNPDGHLRPGQRVGATLRLTGDGPRLTVPRAAILRDFEGGSWVYTVDKPGTYIRRRVGVEAVAGDDAVLAFGPPTGTEVVTDGAAELFGVEFGGNK